MRRLIRILLSRLKDLRAGDFLVLIGESLLKNTPILVYALDLSGVMEMRDEADTELVIRQGEIADIEETIKPMSTVPWEFRCNEYDDVTDFFVACEGKEIRHISWIYHRDDPNRILQLRARDAEIKYCLTLPYFRGRGLYPRVLRGIADHLQKRGLRRVFICADESNLPSIRGIEKAGFERVAKLRLRKVLGFQVSRRLVLSENQS